MVIATAKSDAAADPEKLAIKFLGMSAAIEDPPEVGDTQTFTVTARCVGYGADERQSGGLVGYRKMRVLEVEPGEIVKAPDDPQLSLVEDDLALAEQDDNDPGDES